jgi:hypothetical protein
MGNADHTPRSAKAIVTRLQTPLVERVTASAGQNPVNEACSMFRPAKMVMVLADFSFGPILSSTG